MVREERDGHGAVHVVEHVRGSHWVGKKNPSYSHVGKYDLGWEFPGTIDRTDWVQIREQLKQRRPGLQIAEFPSNVVNDLQMRTDRAPFNDVRVRQAISLAIDRPRIIADTLEGVGASTIPRRPGGSSPSRAIRVGSRRRSASRPTDRRCSWTRWRSC